MADKENLHSGHRLRVRQRYEAEGLDSFQPHQVLELVLFYAIPKRDTNETAHLLLEKFGTLDRVLDADVSSLMEVDGIGYNTAVYLNLMADVARYYARERFSKTVHIENSDEMGEYMCSRIGMMANEVFAVAAFDARRNEIAFEVLNEGFVSQTAVQLRRLAEFAIEHKADMLVISHNHVSGDPLPSQADRETTRRVCKNLEGVGVTVADHIIVAGEKYYSFSANGILPV